MKVLVVDPAGRAQSPIECVLAERGHEVCRRGSGEAAIEACREQSFDLVVLDACQSEPGALELCRALRESPGGGHSFLIVLGRDRKTAVDRLLAAGADDVIHDGELDERLRERLTVVELRAARLTAGRRAEEALRASEARYRQLLESIPDGTLILGLGSWRIEYANLAMGRLLGRDPEELITLGVADIHPPDRIQDVIRELELFLTDVSWRAPVVPCLRRDGAVVWSEINATPLELDGRRCLLGFYRDVTGRVRAEEAVKRAQEQLEARVAERTADLAAANRELRVESDQRLQVQEELRRLKEFSEGILDSMSEGVVVSDTDLRVLFANRAAAEMLGRSSEEVLGASWLEVIPEEQVPVVHSAWARRRQGRADRYELELLHHDGGRVPVLVSDTPLFERDRVTGSLAVITSLAERRRAEAQRVLLSAAVDQAAESVVITDVRGEIRYVNRAFERSSGVSREDALGRVPWALFPGPPESGRIEAMIEALGEGRVWTGAISCRGVDDAPLDFDVTVFPVRDAAGKPVSYVGLLRDVSDEKKLERQLWQAQKMEEIGKLAGGIAHDFNNLLMVIQGTAELLQRRLADDDPLRRQVGVVLRTSRSAADLTRALLDFSRQQVLETADLDLDDLVEGMLPLLRRVLPENISLGHRAATELGNVRADRGRLEQVLMNLCVNSRDAMPGGGSITVETGNVEIGQDYVRSHPWASTGPYVGLAVVDSGCGMDADTLRQVFKPFFTTKKVGKGTGLGMASVYGIVKQHGGMVDIESTPGEGTTVRVLLPRVEPRPEVVAPAAKAGAESAGTGTVLVVEDNEDLRRVLADYLHTLGYRVLTAGDGVEAMEVLQDTEERVQLVITDMGMPRMDGRELYRRGRELRPRLGFLFCTGYAREWEEMADCEDNLTSRVDKPCASDVLGQKVRELLLRVRTADERERGL